jgi:hypothetical protein
VTKRGSNFYFGLGMYFQTGQVIFVPEWPKGEFVSILASFCFSTKSLKCKDAVNMDSTIQSLQVRRIQGPCQPSGRSSYPVWTPICPDDVSSRLDLQDRSASSVRTKCSFHPDPILYGKFSVPACNGPDVLAACPDASQYSISFRFLSKLEEREDQ